MPLDSCLILAFPCHERVVQAFALTLELDQTPMVEDPVAQGPRQMVVGKHRAPFAELDVRRDDHGLALVRGCHHLVEQTRPLDVYRYVAELVDDEDVRPFDPVQHLVEHALFLGCLELEHQVGRLEETDGLAASDRHHAQSDRAVGLSFMLNFT